MVLHDVAPGKPYYALRFNDVPRQFILGGRCFCCRRQGPVDRVRLEKRFGPGAWLSDYDKRLVCLECGNWQENRFVVVGRLIEGEAVRNGP
ncbi:MAG: hypothetical protein KIS96_14540 [Bauldia sp.]|nr:hypothetical protein [Bauldia sp.]